VTGTQQPPTRVEHPATGLLIALASAAAFGGSGPFVKPLLEAGWSPSAAVAVRAGAAGLVLLPLALRSVAWRPGALTSSWRAVVPFGVVGVAGTQLCYFAAIDRLPVGVALLIEYLGPVLLVLYTWGTTRRRPASVTLVGAVVATGGLFLVLDLTGATDLDPIGVAWALGAAVCLACYFTLSARRGELPTLALTASGLAVGAATTAAVGAVGLLPLSAVGGEVDLLGSTVPWWVPMAIVVLISTSFAYVSGVEAATRLGARVASFVGLIEVVFAVLLSWALLDEVPTAIQLLGGALIVAGVVLVRSGQDEDPAVSPAPDAP
jgi:drug/metabolite transporter (DMT)-like permease